MQIRFDCPTPSCVAQIELEPLEGAGDSIECPRCHVKHPVALNSSIRAERRLEQCPICRCREFFIRKDFPQKLGLLIVIVAGTISVATLKSNLGLSWGVLGAAVLVDLALYLMVGRVTVCYACRAEFRGAAPNPEHRGFDLAQSEKY
jgi:hypothetical protein